MEHFFDQKILITGASSGIGKLMAETFAAEGARVILWDINRVALEAVEKELTERGLRCATYLCDVSGRDSVYDTAKRVLREHGPIDILINNAGVVSGRPLLEISDAEIERTFGVNALAPIWTTRAFLPAMIERVVQMGASALTSKVSLISASAISSSGRPETTPALLIRMSIGPCSSITRFAVS